MAFITALAHETLFDDLLNIIKAFNFVFSLTVLEHKILSTNGVCCLQYRNKNNLGHYEEEMIIDFADGSYIIITFVSNTYELELLPVETAFIIAPRHETIKL